MTTRLMCLGQCGYALTTPLARARGFGHRCWAKLPATQQAAITRKIRADRLGYEPMRRRTRFEHNPDQLPITPIPETPVTDEDATADFLRRQRDTIAIPEPGAPTIPATYTDHDDVNPICGCHKRALCLGCGVCTSCDGCYCYED